ncbi:hypothetical protein TRFO_02863 [Tritrichomonas foetus]|uniref:aspartyl aminopeptidase n=1 Tax=Tritrichomonas foetus TaxID=1144522 RepID=A0A1J4L0Q7_9EUKA|nr:hypothetical protein TRFO_02863 [Tritrichomonas foetus]|eukprot:OHT15532.1 hypothetical protein TRFO_02863 [Tritrichomonas foetus]
MDCLKNMNLIFSIQISAIFMEKDYLLDYLRKAPEVHNSVAFFKNMLSKANYHEITDTSFLNHENKKFYFHFQNSLIIFNIKDLTQKNEFISLMEQDLFPIHQESYFPTFEFNYSRFDTPNLDKSWKNRTMKIAGEVIVRDDENLKQFLIHPDYSIGFIQTLDDKNDAFTFAFLGRSKDCQPIIKDYPGPIISSISNHLNIPASLIEKVDVCLVDSNDPCFLGENRQFICGHQLSRMISPFLLLTSFLNIDSPINGYNVFICYHENTNLNEFSRIYDEILNKIGETKNSNISQILVNSYLSESADNNIILDDSSVLGDHKPIEFDEKYKIIKQKIEFDPKFQDFLHKFSLHHVQISIPIHLMNTPREFASFDTLSNVVDVINSIYSCYF